MKKILITGATGFVGSNILNKLSINHKITSLIRNKKKYKIKKNINFLYFKNLNHLDKVLKKKKFDIIIHCATHYKKKHTSKDIKMMIDANIHLGNIILENYKSLQFNKFINFTTVWENFNGFKNNPANLYAAYKLSFTNILNFYKKQFPKINFYNLYLSETFGQNDGRFKILPTIKKNYHKNKPTTINSKNLNINLINVDDIIEAIKLLVNKKIKNDSYIIKNKKNIFIKDLIFKFNKEKSKKIKIKWMSKKLLKEKSINYNKLPGWVPKSSSMKHIIKYIINEY